MDCNSPQIKIIKKTNIRRDKTINNLEERLHLLNETVIGKEELREEDIVHIIYPLTEEGNPQHAHIIIKKYLSPGERNLVVSIPEKLGRDIKYKNLWISTKDTNNAEDVAFYSNSISLFKDGHDCETSIHDMRTGYGASAIAREMAEFFFREDEREKSELEKIFRKRYPLEDFNSLYSKTRKNFIGVINRSKNQFKSDYFKEIRSGINGHDSGKLGIPKEILQAKRKLTEEEFKLVEEHSKIGETIFSGLGELEFTSSIVLNHHERWDGKGYPNGLREWEIPFGSQICSPYDVFDALTTSRPYRGPLNYEDAKKLITAVVNEDGRGDNPARATFRGAFNPFIEVFMFDYQYENIVKLHKIFKKRLGEY